MAEVIWSDNALSDVEDIAAYIERDSTHYATLVATEIFQSTNILIHFPKLGRKVTERNDPKLREIQVPPYRVIYHLNNGVITILTVLHSRRDVRKILRRIKTD